ncbi:acetyl-CoA carboxylase biotin carboxyl carrier protein subunit [Endozoicomonas montiporae]|uniref:Biotin carboxyl carrier protein n=1 Tax=Endozoicomonas montiporae CL-33 TaxID=570277 RepID=A0A142B817_9GAMM|nr:acetyl-CoA carboxylase biotin carboxyl carrier protein subunit [Endozoicomonas montiporae]AMO54893.1 biotin carboxyl carrier protein [Endozoicomonas montiporae CL-33]
MQPKYLLNDSVYSVTPIRKQHSTVLKIGNHTVNARLEWSGPNEAFLMLDDDCLQVYIAQDNQQLFIHLGGKTWHLECIDEFSDAAAGGHTASGQVIAPMPGVVIELNTAVGDQVKEGDSLLLIESMKLQMAIRASVSGTVTGIHVAGAGDSFEKGSILVDIAGEASP